jgi:hypothetical protein
VNLDADLRKALKAAIDQRMRALVEAPADGIPHGTTTGYGRPYGCRCAACCAASTEARRVRRRLESKEERNRKDRDYRRRRREARMAEQ